MLFSYVFNIFIIHNTQLDFDIEGSQLISWKWIENILTRRLLSMPILFVSVLCHWHWLLERGKLVGSNATLVRLPHVRNYLLTESEFSRFSEMGINISRQTDLADNEYLKRFVGKSHIPATDAEFWTGFLQYHIALPSNRCVMSLHSNRRNIRDY